MFLATGILGAITITNIYNYGFDVLLSDSYMQIAFSLFAVFSVFSAHSKKLLDSYRILYLKEDKIETKKVNLVPNFLPIGISLPDKSYSSNEIENITSNSIIKNLVRVTFVEDKEKITVKSFVKLSKLSKLKSLAKNKSE